MTGFYYHDLFFGAALFEAAHQFGIIDRFIVCADASCLSLVHTAVSGKVEHHAVGAAGCLADGFQLCQYIVMVGIGAGQDGHVRRLCLHLLGKALHLIILLILLLSILSASWLTADAHYYKHIPFHQIV